MGGGPRVVVSTAAFHARVRGSVPGLGGLKETKMFLPHPRVKVSIVFTKSYSPFNAYLSPFNASLLSFNASSLTFNASASTSDAFPSPLKLHRSPLTPIHHFSPLAPRLAVKPL